MLFKSQLIKAMLSIILLCATGCQKKEERYALSQNLRLAITTEPPQLDSRKLVDTTSSSIARMFSEGLMRQNVDSSLDYGLAESYTLDEDQKRYIFTLRENLYWSNGVPLTAYDFEYSWKKTLSPDFLSEQAQFLFVIENGQLAKEGIISLDEVGIKALDERHLEVKLVNPTAYFLELTSFCTLFPIMKNIDDHSAHWAQNIEERFPSCGPFRLISWKHDNELKLIKNPSYWDQSNVSIETIHISIIHDESTVLNLFENGEIDFIGVIPFSMLPVDSLPTWRQKNRLQSKSVANSLWYKINTTLPFLKNPKVRMALSLAIDRDSISKNVTLGTMFPSTTFLPPSMQLNNNLIPEVALVEKAQRLFLEGIQEEGIELSELPKFKLSINDAEINRRIAQAIQQQWRENLGLDISIESLEWKVYISKLHNLDYEIARLGLAASVNDPTAYLDRFKYSDPIKGGNNDTGWQDLQYIALLDQASQTADESSRKKILAEAERLIVEASPIIPLFHYTVNWMQSAHLNHVCVTDLGQADFKWAKFSLDKESP